MPSSTASSSAIANMVSQRKRLSAVRQVLGLEANPATTAKIARNAAKPAAPEEDFDFSAHVLDPEKEAKMHQMASDWHYAQDEAAGAPAPDPAVEAPPSAPAATTKPSPSVDAAMAPIAAFYKENGRMPNSEELKQHSLKAQAKQQLGRDPTIEELSLFAAKPAMK